jgi:hypothetical protein
METKIVKNEWTWNRMVEKWGEPFAKKYTKWFNSWVDKEEELFNKVATKEVMKQLFNLINETYNFGDISYTFEVVKSRENEKCIKFESENLSKKSVFLNAAWEDFHVNCFNYGRSWIQLEGKEGAKEKHYGGYEEIDVDMTKEPKIGFSTDIHFSYNHWCGGSNGAEIGWAYYDGEKWTLETKKSAALERKREQFERELAWEARTPSKEPA